MDAVATERATSQLQALKAPFVSAEYGKCVAGLVVSPSSAIESAVPLQGEPNAFLDRALDQHAVLRRRLEAFGVELRIVESGATGFGAAATDLAVVVDSGAVLMRPSDLGRRPEVAVVDTLLTEAGVTVLGRIDAPGLLDGGDVIVTSEKIYVGVPHGEGRFARRGNVLARRQLAALTGRELVEVPVSARFPRLRSVVSIVDDKTVVIGADAVDADAFSDMKRIVLPRGEEYGASLLVLSPRRVIANLRFLETPAILRKAGIRLESLDMWELGKLGIAPASLMLAVKRI